MKLIFLMYSVQYYLSLSSLPSGCNRIQVPKLIQIWSIHIQISETRQQSYNTYRYAYLLSTIRVIFIRIDYIVQHSTGKSPLTGYHLFHIAIIDMNHTIAIRLELHAYTKPKVSVNTV